MDLLLVMRSNIGTKDHIPQEFEVSDMHFPVKKTIVILVVIIMVSCILMMLIFLNPRVYETNNILDYGRYIGNYDNETPTEFINSFFPLELSNLFSETEYHYKAKRFDTFSYEVYLQFHIEDPASFDDYVEKHVSPLTEPTVFPYDESFMEYTISNVYSIASNKAITGKNTYRILNAQLGKVLVSKQTQQIIYVAIGHHDGGGTDTSELSYFFDKFEIDPVVYAATAYATIYYQQLDVHENPPVSSKLKTEEELRKLVNENNTWAVCYHQGKRTTSFFQYDATSEYMYFSYSKESCVDVYDLHGIFLYSFIFPDRQNGGVCVRCEEDQVYISTKDNILYIFKGIEEVDCMDYDEATANGYDFFWFYNNNPGITLTNDFIRLHDDRGEVVKEIDTPTVVNQSMPKDNATFVLFLFSAVFIIILVSKRMVINSKHTSK